ncbi:MAG: hypothetical protein QM621_03770, partial [Aeromicrobium sp.]|uniref:hypothetical protein n=1 Tax=Aeromicrobium sp. TaxID=1871063 RepID=UPI0039E54F97
AARAGAPLTLSVDTPLAVPGAAAHVEDHEAWLRRLSGVRSGRVRLVGSPRRDASQAIHGRAEISLWTDPPTQSGRIELLAFLREQAISVTRHHRGRPLAPLDGLLPRGPR